MRFRPADPLFHVRAQRHCPLEQDPEQDRLSGMQPIPLVVQQSADERVPAHGRCGVAGPTGVQGHSHVKVLVKHVPEQQSLLKLQMLPLAIQQVLLEQTCPPWHIVPQPPQFCGSELVSTQVPLQQAPEQQSPLAVHVFPPLVQQEPSARQACVDSQQLRYWLPLQQVVPESQQIEVIPLVPVALQA